MKRGSWKNAERRVARSIGTKRIPIVGRKGPDVEHPLYDIELKCRASIPQYLQKWLEQSHVSEHKKPVLILHQKGRHQENDLIILRWRDFSHLLNLKEEPHAEDTSQVL